MQPQTTALFLRSQHGDACHPLADITEPPFSTDVPDGVICSSAKRHWLATSNLSGTRAPAGEKMNIYLGSEAEELGTFITRQLTHKEARAVVLDVEHVRESGTCAHDTDWNTLKLSER